MLARRPITTLALLWAALVLSGCCIPGLGGGPDVEVPDDAEYWTVGMSVDDSPGADAQLRTEPSAEARVVRELEVGDELALLEERGEWSRVAAMSNPKKPVVGWIHASAIHPHHTEEVYRAWLSAQDRLSSKGAPVRKAVVILRQDRANVHRFGKRDDGDMLDSWFRETSARAGLVNGELQVSFEPGAKEIIETRTPYVQVVLNHPSVSVSILDNGAPYTAPASTKKKRKRNEKAMDRCLEKWCFEEVDGGPRCPGEECPELTRCLRRAGARNPLSGCWGG